MGNEIIEQVKDFPMQWIFAQYELGRPVSEIAAATITAVIIFFIFVLLFLSVF